MEAPPLRTELNPTVPTTSRYFANMGRRMSPSTSTTLCSASANANAMLIAVVDLPSLGSELPTTITRGGLSTARNCRFVRSFRNDSAMPELARSKAIPGSFRRSLSSGMVPTRPTWVMSSTVSRSLTVLSRRSRRTARPTPRSSPTARPLARLRSVLGTTGSLGMDARCSTTTRASGLVFPSAGVSSSLAMVTNSSDSVFAMSRARTADSSRTSTTMSTVSGLALALIFSPSSSAVMSSPSLSMVRCARVSPMTSSV